MFDTHAHLNFPQLLSRIDELIRESKKAGLTGIIIASSNLEDSKKAVELAGKYQGFLWVSIGIHPQKTDPENTDSVKNQLSQLEQLLHPRGVVGTTPRGCHTLVVAIGETGLDFSLPPPGEEQRGKKEQEELFLGQIKLALKYDLPLVIHSREASDEIFKILFNFENWKLKIGSLPRGVFHCYSGGKKRIQKVLNLPGEWYFGVDGNLTYDLGLQNVVKLIPKDRLLLETDAPFLPPEPYRGQMNTPAYLPLIAEKMAEVWQIDVGEVIEKTVENTKRLFGI
ncbi:MAG: TatD family hydrolase [Patescibacteria group bacterium]|nr:TatD family hydrolase [Patescibacteria group bacterium]